MSERLHLCVCFPCLRCSGDLNVCWDLWNAAWQTALIVTTVQPYLCFVEAVFVDSFRWAASAWRTACRAEAAQRAEAGSWQHQSMVLSIGTRSHTALSLLCFVTMTKGLSWGRECSLARTCGSGCVSQVTEDYTKPGAALEHQHLLETEIILLCGEREIKCCLLVDHCVIDRATFIRTKLELR